MERIVAMPLATTRKGKSSTHNNGNQEKRNEKQVSLDGQTHQDEIMIRLGSETCPASSKNKRRE
jgi:hypothetical protein